jgi:hypothetical protein
MKQTLAIGVAVAGMVAIMAIGEPTVQSLGGDGAQAQHNRCVRDQACYRRCRNDLRKRSAQCCRLCRG